MGTDRPYGGEIIIPIRATFEDQASPQMQALDDSIKTLSSSVNALGIQSAAATTHVRVQGQVTEQTTIPTRALGRDLMSLAFGISFLARHLGLGANPAMREFLFIMMLAGVAIRSVSMIGYLTPLIHSHTIATALATLAQHGFNMELMTTVALVSALTLGVPLLILAYAYAAAQAKIQAAASIPSMQMGGIVPQTGLYLLHKDEFVLPGPSYTWNTIKGETAVPATPSYTWNTIKGETAVPATPSYTWINMTNQFGAVSSSVDVDNMLGEMAYKVSTASRRRVGR